MHSERRVDWRLTKEVVVVHRPHEGHEGAGQALHVLPLRAQPEVAAGALQRRDQQRVRIPLRLCAGE